MASSTPPHYSLAPSKPQQTPHHPNPLQKHPPKHPKTSPRLHSSSPSSSTPSPISTAYATLSNPTCSASTANTSASSIYGSSSPSPSLRNAIYQPLYSNPRPQLGPEFRRSRTTRVISKRNTASPKPAHDHHRAASDAAAGCVAQLLRSSSDDRSVSNLLQSYRPNLAIPEDYCYILHEIGDREKCPLKGLKFSQFAMPLMRSAKEKGRILTATISALGKMGRHDLAKNAFDVAVYEGYGNTVYAYSALISAYARNGLLAEAMAVFGAMKSNGLRPNNVTFNSMIDACVKGGADLPLTAGLFREMIRSGVSPDRKTFNSLLAGFSRTGHLDDATMLFEEMINSGVGQDIYTYNTFVDAICKCGNIELAVQVMSEMTARGVRPNVVTYSTVIDGYAKLDRFNEALSLYEEMKMLRIPLDRICYNTLLSVYVKTGKYEDIARVCEEMDMIGVEKDTVTYNSLINGYGKQGRLDVVRCLIQDMRERRVAPSVLTYSTLIDIYSKAGMYGDAANVFVEFRETGLKPDVVLYSSFIDTLSKNGLVECAVWLLDEMNRMGIEPNVVTYNAVIDAFGKSKMLFEEGEAGDEKRDSGECGLQIAKVFGQLARGIGRPIADDTRRRSEELFSILGLFQRMGQQGVKPNVVTFSAILNACSRCNSFEDASLLLEQLRSFDNFVYGVAHGLLMGCIESWIQARSMFNELRRMDQPTSSAFYNALTDMLWHFGQRLGAQKVVLEGVQRHVWENTLNEFSLDLHLMSSGAAQAMVHAWLLSIRSSVFEGRKLPEFVSILTGWGKHSKVVGASTLRRVIEALLNSIGAPFQLERFNIGKFVSPGAVVAAWLKDPGTVNILLLHDERSQASSSSPLSLLPRLQTLQL